MQENIARPLDWARVAADTRDRAVLGRLGTWERINRRQGRPVTGRREGSDLVFEAWEPSTNTRAIDSFVDHPGLTEQLLAVQGLTARPWRAAGIREALGVPSIHRAVTLISNTGGGLSLEGYRKGVKLVDDDRPQLIVRPNPLTTPRDFYRDTIYAMATRGEAWWHVPKRDGDGNAIALVNINPASVTVTEDPRDILRPVIEWGPRSTARGTLRREDMLQITLMRETGGLRGYGPLQMCGAAVSIAVESQEWAANFFAAGGYPNIWIRAAGDLSGGTQGDPDVDEAEVWMSEIQRLKAQWIETAPNTPRVTDEGILDVKQFDPNPQGAQMLDAREHQTGDAARMFGIPAKLMEYNSSGSSLTYQNLAEVMTEFLRTCLIPNYLTPIEQTMSDLLPRSTIARFYVGEVNRADVKTRFEVYKLGTESGTLTAELAQEMEGILPGSVETAPVPLAPPAAIPAPIVARSEHRCDGMRMRRRNGVSILERCGKLLSEGGEFVGQCPRCKKQFAAA